VAIGLPGHRSPLPGWRCVSVGSNPAIVARHDGAGYRLRASTLLAALKEAMQEPLLAAWLNVLRQAASLMVKDPAAALWTARTAVIWLSRGWRWIRTACVLYWDISERFQQLCQTARGERVDLWLANDWTTLPIARRLAAEQGVPFVYDTHELSVDEYAQRWAWRLMQQPVIAAIEGMAMKEAAFVSCVSEGIAQRLSQFYGLTKAPLLVRNTPPYESIDFRPTGERIRVLYHGLVSPGRGLEACIESVHLWRPEFSLTIRGPGNPEYLAYLAQLIYRHDVGNRVTFAPAIPMIDLVRAAAKFDVGLFALPSHSLQNIYALPNKFFEYMMAGLTLCVSDLPEMTRILKERDLGVLIAAVTPQDIATAINRLDREAIDAYKRNGLAAAREFNWENECGRLLGACECAVSAYQRRHFFT
jgi:glycosyltransferase involved in cell wall biosynthesis